MAGSESKEVPTKERSGPASPGAQQSAQGALSWQGVASGPQVPPQPCAVT